MRVTLTSEGEYQVICVKDMREEVDLEQLECTIVVANLIKEDFKISFEEPDNLLVKRKYYLNSEQ